MVAQANNSENIYTKLYNMDVNVFTENTQWNNLPSYKMTSATDSSKENISLSHLTDQSFVVSSLLNFWYQV